MEDLEFLSSTFGSEGNQEDLTIFIVEDDLTLSKSIKKYLSKKTTLNIKEFPNSISCLNFIKSQQASKFCLLTDISLENGESGLRLIEEVRELNVEFFAIAMTGFASIETAISATKRGVFHYLTKPFQLDNLVQLISEGFSQTYNTDILSESNYHEHKRLKTLGKIKLKRPNEDEMFCSMIGKSRKMREVFDTIERVATSNSTVLIMGPSGTGKELVASAIHRLSRRKIHDQVSVNCGAIPGELLESELFGHIKGSFTGAISNRKGRFEVANNGTIFLDEIGDMPFHLQVKLLRVLQTKQITPVGSDSNQNVDVRVIAATHQNLEKAVAEGRFREDLFYRLNVIPIIIPSLRERREDIPLLIAHFINKFVSGDKSNEIDFTDDALEHLFSYDWPGNVRELENVIERLIILRGGMTISAEDLPAKIYRNNPMNSNFYKNMLELPEKGIDIKQVLGQIESSLIEQALERTSGNKNQASKLLKLNRTTLIEKLKKKSLAQSPTIS